MFIYHMVQLFHSSVFAQEELEQNNCSYVFVAAFFLTSQTGKQLKCSSVVNGLTNWAIFIRAVDY